MLFVCRAFAALGLLCAVSAVSVQAEEPPEILWDKTFGGAYGDRFYSLQQTSDGGFILCGKISAGFFQGSCLFVRTDGDGNEIWNTVLDAGDRKTGTTVQQTSDGGFIVGGNNGLGGNGLWLTRTDSDGNQLWSKVFGETGYGSSVQQMPDGGFILAGYTNSRGAGENDCWLIRTDGDGNELWNKTFGGTGNDFCHSVQLTTDGGLILAGGHDTYSTEEGDLWLIRTDGDGNELWSNTFGGTRRDYANSVQQTSDGGFILLGETLSYGAGDNDFFLVRTDGDGNELWSKAFGGTSYEYPTSVQQTLDGGFSLLGHTNSFGAGGGDFWLIKTDSEGNESWNKTFGGSGNEWTYPGCLQQTSDGGVAMAGSTTSYGAGGEDAWLVRTAGDAPPPCDLEVGLSGYPEEILRGDYLSFDAMAANPCDAPLTFDRALMNITGPASLEKTLYDGEPFPVAESVATNLSLAVPPGAPLGTYTVQVTIFRGGEAIHSDAFEVDVSG